MCSHRSPRGDRKRLKEEYFPLFVLFVLFGQAKRTLKEKYHKETFIFSYFCMTKRRVQGGEATSERRRRDGVYQKSFKRAFFPLKKHPPRARVSRASHAWRVRAANDKVKIGDFAAPHSFGYTTRANISREKAEQIRARIVCTPAEKRWAGVGKALALTEWRWAKAHGWRRVAWRKNMPKSGITY